tara:strand:+ start:1858 stop:2712 length:855 start_codon:yes stop_codon:yes gene_type:complete
MHRKINLFFIIFFSLSVLIAQDVQISLSVIMKMYAPVVGPINVKIDQTIAPGFYKYEENAEIKRFIFRWMNEGAEGEIMISGTNKIINYNKDDEVYWLENPEDFFFKPQKDSTDNNNSSISFSIKNDENGVSPKVNRMTGQNIEIINGYRTKKWVTSIFYTSKKLIIEEWIVEKLPLLDLQDSLRINVYRDFTDEIELDSSNHSYNLSNFGLNMGVFSNGIISKIDTINNLDPILGKSVKTKVLFFEGKEKPKFEMSMEILELYAESVDTAFFTIPEDYKRINN